MMVSLDLQIYLPKHGGFGEFPAFFSKQDGIVVRGGSAAGGRVYQPRILKEFAACRFHNIHLDALYMYVLV